METFFGKWEKLSKSHGHLMDFLKNNQIQHGWYKVMGSFTFIYHS